ncbi:MAG TPA: hypothetical protein VMS40_22540 [Vicinamibacterales bacterium]|nr:hypothetical protein [Vicinamibacterales bacterium]
MKTVLKLVIAIALLNAVVRGADSAWNYYQLKDAAQRALLFGAQASSKQIHEQIMERAVELRLPLMPNDLMVSWRSGRRIAEASYTQQIEFFPKYVYPILFSFNVDTVSVGTPPDDESYPPVRK